MNEAHRNARSPFDEFLFDTLKSGSVTAIAVLDGDLSHFTSEASRNNAPRPLLAIEVMFPLRANDCESAETVRQVSLAFAKFKSRLTRDDDRFECILDFVPTGGRSLESARDSLLEGWVEFGYTSGFVAKHRQ